MNLTKEDLKAIEQTLSSLFENKIGDKLNPLQETVIHLHGTIRLMQGAINKLKETSETMEKKINSIEMNIRYLFTQGKSLQDLQSVLNTKIDGLGEKVQKLEQGVKKLEQGAEKLEQGVGKLENRVESLEHGMETLEKGVEILEKGMVTLEKGVETLEKKTNSLQNKVDEIYESVDSHTASLVKIENTIGGYDDAYKWNNEQIIEIKKHLGL